MKKKKKVYFTSLIFIVCLSALFLGNQHYQAKIQKAFSDGRKDLLAAEAKREAQEKKAQEKKAQEEKNIYDKHKGEKLVYSPMGDSLAEGFFATTEDTKYVSVLSQLIEEKIGYDVKTEDGFARAGSGLRDLTDQDIEKVMADNPDLITIEFGTNDADVNKTNTYSNPDEFEQRLSSLIDTLRSNEIKKPKIILVTTWNIGRLSLEYDPVIKKVGKEKQIPVANINSIWQNREDTSGPEGMDTYQGLSDIYHPNDKGHKEIAEVIYEQAYEILK